MDITTELAVLTGCAFLAGFFASMIFDKIIKKQTEGNVSTDKLLDTIEKKGYRAHLYLPTISEDKKDFDTVRALELLAHRGFVITDQNENIVGKVATARLSSDEIASERRASFKILK